MNLKTLLIESWKELKQRPSFFVPKITTSIIGSLWLLSVINLIGDPFTQATVEPQALLLSLIAFPVILYLGLLSPVIVAEMVKNNGKLIQSTKAALSYTPKLIATVFVLLILYTILIVPFSLGLVAVIITESLVIAVLGSLTTLIGAAAISYRLYFLPVTLTEHTALKSIKESSTTSTKHKKEVTLLLLISIFLAVLSVISSGAAQRLGMIGFILGRAVSSAITTYTLIVAPKAYFEME